MTVLDIYPMHKDRFPFLQKHDPQFGYIQDLPAETTILYKLHDPILQNDSLQHGNTRSLLLYLTF